MNSFDCLFELEIRIAHRHIATASIQGLIEIP